MSTSRGDYWGKFLRAVEEAGKVLVSCAAPEFHGSTWWGSSDEFAREVARDPGMAVDPRDVVPLTGKPLWSPADEPVAPAAALRAPLKDWQCGPPCPWRCDHCRDAVLEEGSKIFCPKCCRVGPDREHRLALQRKLAGRAPAGGGR